jgi:putative hemolysin
MLADLQDVPTRPLRSLAVTLASNLREVREAQRLRYLVFSEELGACVPGREQGIDCDVFDAYCDHLIVRDAAAGSVVGTYRILPPSQARRLGRYYAEGEFDLGRLAALRSEMVEVGRACIHRDHRSGAVIHLLWKGLADYMQYFSYGYLAGCASIGLADGGVNAARVYKTLAGRFLRPAPLRTFPLEPAPLATGPEEPCTIPPLIRGYVRMGGYVCGEPAWDRAFNCADLFMLLPMSRLAGRYARHFLRNAAA